jgi:hypothetical protein
MASVDAEKAAKGDAIAPTGQPPSICEGDGKAEDTVVDIVYATESEYTEEQFR